MTQWRNSAKSNMHQEMLAGAPGFGVEFSGAHPRVPHGLRSKPQASAFGSESIRMVGLGRVELPTNGLGNRCSIHLSYRPWLGFYQTWRATFSDAR
jgi:hypothetical protein